MRKERKEIKKKLLSTFVVLAMVLSSMVLLMTPAISREGEEGNGGTPSVRIYGEEDAVYPTHSYYGENDFIYPEEYDPFDPGIIEKDSITFNPAFIDGHGGEYEIRAQGDASEKVFLRAFYEPEYTHPVDWLMDDCSDVTLYPVEEFDAIVTETTYFLVTLNERDPTVGYPYPDVTKLYLPYASLDPTKPGMDEAGLLDLMWADDMNTRQLTDGGIMVEKVFEFYDDSYIGETLRFMDHKIKIVNFEDNDPLLDNLDVQVSYVGNMDDALSATESLTIISEFIESSAFYFFDRLNNYRWSMHPGDISDPCFRWYLRIESADEDYLRIALGRKLIAGETFYVDGVRYDMPAIYVEGDNSRISGDDDDDSPHYGGFKYITLQSPIPKCETIWDYPLWKNVDDFSHVTSQYLANLPKNTPVWVLPPFDDTHWMIDDIDLEKFCVPLNGLMIEDEKDALEFYYIEEDVEERFDSSLTERLNTSENGDDDDDCEHWQWYNVYTMPNRYTEFVLPNQETTDDTYVEESGYADGNEYLITTSLIAPNSNVDTDRDDTCKDKYYEEHEIFDRVLDIALNDEREDYYEMPRFVYEFDAEDPTDFYINEGSPNPSVRIYGEEDVPYPTQSYTEELDFIYDEEFHPFDPGIIQKDSITFNPAFIDGHGGEYEIRAQGDASEKVFLRAFYEPGYTHPVDKLMDDFSDVLLYPVEEFDGIVTETTYFLVTLYDRDPTVGYPGSTEFMLPYCSMDPMKPGMDEAGLLDLAWAWDRGTKQLTDGAIAVEKTFEFDNIDYTTDIPICFMDHKVIIKNFEDNDPLDDKLDLEILYVGNMNEAIPAKETVTIWENSFGIGPQYRMYFNRENDMVGPWGADPAFRWYLRIENADLDYLRITLGRELWAGETFYVDGVRYDMPAIYVEGDNMFKAPPSGDDDDDFSDEYGFKYITLQSPIPKCETIWFDNPLSDNVDDFSHVTSQYLANLPLFTDVWLLPPFDDDHIMIDDIDLHKDKCGGYSYEVPFAGLMIEEEKSALEFYYIEEAVEDRFDSSLTERLLTDEKCLDQDDDDDDCEHWEWYNVYTMPNRYTEFVLPDQETTDDTYLDDSGYADGNEYLITSSLIAPNSELDTFRGDCEDDDDCKYYDEHEIFSILGGGKGNSGGTQLCMILDGSGSIDPGEWSIMINGLAEGVRKYIPHDGSVEFTVVQFADYIDPDDARVEIGPVVLTSGNYMSIATSVENIKQAFEMTPLAAGINKATEALAKNVKDYKRQVINIVTDGSPNVPSLDPTGAAEAARANMISTLGLVAGEDEIDAEGIGISTSNKNWLRDDICWPGSYDNWPPTGPGWIRVVSTFTQFAEALDEKFELIFGMHVPRFAFEFDAFDGTGLFINGEAGEPPVADANGPYYGVCNVGIPLDGSGSYDMDEGGSSIVQYDWKFYSGDSWHNDIGPNPISTYATTGEFMVTLRVHDDEGATDTDTATVYITSCGEDDDDDDDDDDVTGAVVEMEDVEPCSETTDFGYLKALNIAEDIGSCEVTLLYDPSVVTIIGVDDSDFETMVHYDDGAGTLSITAFNTVLVLTGDINIARIEFGAVGDPCDIGLLDIDDSELFTADTLPDSVSHITNNGYASICPDDPGCSNGDCDGDMDGNGATNSADVRYLAKHIAGDPLYAILHAEGDVNCVGGVNSADVRHLALFIAGDPSYTPLCPVC